MEINISKFKNIEKMTYEMEIVTPMFLSGANPKEAELRVPPIKGLLRFWWRALHPHLVVNNDYKKLKEEEAKLFGDSGDKVGKSKTKISINYDLLQIGKYRPLPHSKTKKFPFNCIVAGQKFYLTLYAPKKVHLLFKLTSFLGGIGKRSRRGFGSFKIINSEEEVNLENILTLIKEIVKTDNLFELKNNKIILNKKFSAQYPYIKTIQLGKFFDSYDDLLETVGQTTHNFNSDFIGSAKGFRLASPIYVSSIKLDENSYRLIITTLNLAYKSKIKGNDTRKDFIKNLI